jgi:serine/threonine protein kinase
MEIPGYEVTELLSRGRVASIHRARQTSLDRPVSIKILEPSLVGDADAVASFEDECQRLAGLLHPHLLSGITWGRVGDRPYLVLESVEGRTLEALIRAEGALAEDRGLQLGIQAGKGLAFLAGRGLVHGDPSPTTVLVTASDVVKLARVHLVREQGWDGMDRHGRPAGTAGYMSPEQATGEVAPDERSAVFSLGALLFFALSGHSPVEDATAEIVGGRVVERAPALSTRRADLSKFTLEAVGRFLQPDRDARPETLAEAVETLEKARAQSGQRLRVQSAGSKARRARVRRVSRARSARRDRPRR